MEEPIIGGDASRALVAWIRQQWKEVLDAEEVSLEDNFFELGGDSLAALQIVGRLRQQGIDIEVTDVFENALLSEFAEHVSQLLGGGGLGTEFDVSLSRGGRTGTFTAADLTLPPVVAAPDQRHEPFPLTDMQEAYWMGRSGLLELGQVDGHNYREYECVAELGSVEAALRKLIERHDMLRAIIRPDGRQQILPEVPPYRIRHEDLRGLPAPEVEVVAARCRAEMTASERPTDEWPPFEIRALVLDGGRLRVHMRFEFMVYDARTQRLLLQEWARLVARPGTELPPLDVSFRDYVMSLQQLKEHPVWKRASDHWLDRAPRLPARPDLPQRRIQTERPTLQGLRAAMRLDRWLRLGNAAAASGLTLSTVLCTAFADVLAAWSAEERFILTMMLLDRLPLHPQINDVVGNFSSTLLLEVDASPRTFVERARALQQRLSHDLRFRHFPAGQVLREVNRLRGAPLAATSPFVFVSTLGVDRQFGSGTFWRYVRGSLSTPQILVDMRVAETDGLPAVRCEYVQEAFPDGLLPDLFDTYVGLIERLADDPQSWKELHRRLAPRPHLEQRAAANATAAPLPEERLHMGFERQVEARADQPAVIAPERCLSYRELDERVEALARRLTALGAGPGQLVAIVAEKGWEQVVAALAILRTGAAYVPINPRLPRDRRFRLLEICEVRIALTQPALDETLEWPATVGARLVVAAADAAAPPERAAPRQGPDDLAYVIFTSGSTGVPKGVMMGHRGAVNTLVDVNRRFGIGAGDRVLAISALDFDLSVYDVFGLLGCGGALVLPDHERDKDPGHWLELLERERVTVWNSVPALLELLVEYAEAAGRKLPDSLRVILLSGDWIPVSLPGRVQAMLPRARVVSLGGATEAAVWSIFHPIDRVDPRWTSIPYGKPLANQTMHVLDSRLEDRPIWAKGELYIGGAGVAQGYWRDELKTADRFIVHPVTGERLYRTGDLGRYLPDGNIEFLGRADAQVKVQGYRIELGEIEATLALHPGVQAAYATVREVDRAGGAPQRARGGAGGAPRASSYKRLLAYVVPAKDRGCTQDELVRHLRQKLPEYMVPQDIVLIDQLPLSPNGKVDWRALPDPVKPAASSRADATGAAPRTPVARKLAEIWAELLGAPVGVDQDFFGAGGNSVLAVQLIVRIARDFGYRLPVSTLFAHPTIESMAPLLERPAAVTGEQRSLVPLAPQGSRAPLFLVHPVGGNVHCYLALARLLSEHGRPVYGFQARGADGTEEALLTVEQMATAYLEELRRHRPAGPYHLGGWSMGGVVALEMAQRLRAAGERVPQLVLIDAPSRTEPVAGDAQLLRRFGQDLVGARATIGELPGATSDGLARVVEIARGAGLELDPSGERLAGLFALFGAHARALAAYAPRPYDGSAWLFEADRDGTDTAAWPELVRGQLRRTRLPGSTHHTLLQDPSLSVIAEQIDSLLEET